MRSAGSAIGTSGEESDAGAEKFSAAVVSLVLFTYALLGYQVASETNWQAHNFSWKELL